MDWGNVISGLLGGGLVLGIVALLKVKPDNRKTNAEADRMSAEAWALLVKAQSEDIIRLRLRIEALEADKEENEKSIDEYELQVAGLKAENESLRRKVADLESKVKALEGRGK